MEQPILEPILECKNLTKNYKYESALNSINLSITSGKIVGLLGPNGSGKTTLIKLANDLLKPTSGEILIKGLKPGIDTKKIISYLPDRNYFSDTHTVNELINLFSGFYSDFNKEKALKMLNDLKIEPKRKFKTLSKGIK